MNPTAKNSPRSTKPATISSMDRDETPFEALSGICSVLVVGMFILTFLAQNHASLKIGR